MLFRPLRATDWKRIDIDANFGIGFCNQWARSSSPLLALRPGDRARVHRPRRTLSCLPRSIAGGIEIMSRITALHEAASAVRCWSILARLRDGRDPEKRAGALNSASYRSPSTTPTSARWLGGPGRGQGVRSRPDNGRSDVAHGRRGTGQPVRRSRCEWRVRRLHRQSGKAP